MYIWIIIFILVFTHYLNFNTVSFKFPLLNAVRLKVAVERKEKEIRKVEYLAIQFLSLNMAEDISNNALASEWWFFTRTIIMTFSSQDVF